MKTIRFNYSGYHGLLAIVFMVWGCLMVSCSDDDGPSTGYDPSKQVSITDFTPRQGGVGQKLVVYGDNFGNDTSKVRVKIGGIPATLINVKNDALYCFVPSKAYSGIIEVSVGDDSLHMQTAVAKDSFNYQRKMVVGSLCGYKNEYDDQGWHDGPFSTCSGFTDDGCLAFDPLDHTKLYAVYDNNAHGIQVLDLKNQEVSTILSLSDFDNQRLRSIDFSLDGQWMFISTDRADRQQQSPSVWAVKRNDDGTFSDNSYRTVIAAYMQCNGAAVHPVNGELYFNSFERGQVFRLDLNNFFNAYNTGSTWKPNFVDGNFKEIFTIQDVGWEFKIFIHPSGKYCYIVVINQNYILRSDYNEATKTFAPPYVVAGQDRVAGWQDGVGTSALMNRPYQGVFVKNENYEKEGRDDIYDFYFTDCLNQCVRYLTPDGIVRTYAGRGTSSQTSDTNVWGTEDGDLRVTARFRDPTGLAYDESNNTFYILDKNNRKIRTISMEK